jgi:hypothetical protein
VPAGPACRGRCPSRARIRSTPGRLKRTLIATETPTQSGRAFNPTYRSETHPGFPLPRPQGRATGAAHGHARNSQRRLPRTARSGRGRRRHRHNGRRLNAASRVNTALVQAYGPVCIERFKQQPNVEAKWVELTKIDSWRRDDYIKRTGFATPPGSEVPNSAVADACAEALSKLIAMQAPSAK